MTRCPVAIRDSGFVDGLLETTLGLDRDSDPIKPGRGLDAIAIAPVAPGVLDAVEQDDLVGRAEHVEIAPPGKIVRLGDDYCFDFQTDRSASVPDCRSR